MAEAAPTMAGAAPTKTGATQDEDSEEAIMESLNQMINSLSDANAQEELSRTKPVKTEAGEAHFIIMEPSPSPYITHTGGPSHVNVVAGTEDEAKEAIRTVLEATARQGKHGRTWCTNPACPWHGSDVDTESITSSASSECDNPDCTEHGSCQVSGEEEDVVKLLSQAAKK